MAVYSQQKGRILRDPKFLQPLSDSACDQPLCREVDLNEMKTLLSDLFRHGSGRNLFFCGKPGTGKTLCTQYMLNGIRRQAVENDAPLAVGYVNAGKTRTPYFTMLEILRSMGVNVPDSGWQMFRLKQAFEKALRDKAAVIAVDEFDALLSNQREPLIYYLSRQPRVTLVLIGNKLEDISTLPPRLLSTLQPKILLFQPYTMEEAKSILKDRASKAFCASAISDELLSTIARTTAQAEDIRLGFTMLLSAAHIAEEKGKTRIDADDVEQAVRECRQPGILVKIRLLEQKLKTLQENHPRTNNTAV